MFASHYAGCPSTQGGTLVMHTIAIAVGTTCLSIVADPRNIRLRNTKITLCVLAVRFLCGKTLSVRHENSLNRVLL
jgi:hypothetical protein